MSATPDGLEAREPILDPDEPPRGRSRGWTLAALALSAGALALMVRVYVPTTGAASPAPIVASPDGPRVVAPAELPPSAGVVAAPSGVTPTTPEPAPTTAPATAPTTAPATATAPGPSQPSVAIPDFSDLRVPAARRLARAHGLRLVIRDPNGYAINQYLSSGFRIRSQRVAPGTVVPEGTEVRALAEDPSPIVAGY